MKKVFKVLSVTLMLTLILNLTIISVTAKNAIKDQRKDEKKQEQLVEKYDLLLVSEKDIPEGVVPLKFDSFEEMDNYFSKLESMNNVIEIEPKNITQSLLENHDIGIRSTIFDYGSGTQKATQSLVFSKMNLKIKYDWFMEDGIYTYTKIKSSSAYLTGITAGISWETTDGPTTTLKNGNRNCLFEVSGTLNNIIYTPVGDVAFYSKDYDLSATFHAAP